jgi:GNAT superfamily N-acetyltransferase
VRVVPFDELPPSYERQRAALQLGAFNSLLDRELVGRLRRRRYLLSEYVGLFAVEGGRLLGQTVVLRLPYVGRDGPVTVAGIASVTTRPASGRQGIARALLEEAHRREAAAGQRYALLWTNRSWFAHRLYASLGYRDVYSPPSAVRSGRGRAPRQPGTSLRPAQPNDLGPLEALHAACQRGRTGFAVRPRGFLTVERAAGRSPPEKLLVYRRGGRVRGYAAVVRRPGALSIGELVSDAADRSALLAAVERSAPTPGGVVELDHTPVRDLAARLRARGYLVQEGTSWYVLMARPLGRRVGEQELRRELAVDLPSFVCMTLDRF